MGNSKRKFKLGLGLIILSITVFLSMLIIPFLKAAGSTKITLTTGMIVLGEVTFWAGGFLVGKEILNRYKSSLNPKNWFRKKTGDIV